MNSLIPEVPSDLDIAENERVKHNWDKYFDTTSEYWQKIQKIYEENEHFPKKVIKNRNLHHKFPRSFSKLEGSEIDNSEDNLVSLSLVDHFLVHYYLWKCCTKKYYRGMMATTFYLMRKKAIKYASDKTIEELALDYANIMKDASDLHSKALKGKTKSEEHKRKIAEARKGIPPWNKGMPSLNKGKKMSEDQKRKIAESCKGRHWYNNGKIAVFVYECPQGFVKGRL